MPNFEAFVRAKLPALGLTPAREQEIVAELAQQLEQVSAQAVAEGADGATAQGRAEAHIPDWAKLARSIAAAEVPLGARLPLRMRLALAGRDAASDWRLALRGLRRAPGFASVAILTLALGIGANTAIFTWVRAELLAALPFQQPDRLVALDEHANGRTVSVPYPDYLDWEAQNAAARGAFASLAWYQTLGLNLSGAGTPEVVSAGDVSGNFFATLGIHPQWGRGFAAGADSANALPEAIITSTLAARQFGAASAAVGQRLDLNMRAYTVVGVLNAQFRDYNETEVFLPVGLFLKTFDRGSHNDADVLARLTPEATEATALAQQRSAMAKLALAYPEEDAAEGAVVRPLRALYVGQDAPMLWLLFGAVGLVLLIACVNVANLMLVRTAGRREEWAVRAALGAGRGRLVRQLLVESLALALLGGAAGVGLAALALRGLQAVAPVQLHLNWPVLGFALLICAISAVLFGLAPARSAGRRRLEMGSRGARRARAGSALVVGEVALALVLTIAAGLALRSFSRLMEVNPGFAPQQVLSFGTNLTGGAYEKPAARIAIERQILRGLAALPGVRSAGIGTNLPMTNNHDRGDVTIAGKPLPERGHFPHPDLHSISPGYLSALGLPLLRGRNLSESDGPNAPEVALVSASFANANWPGEDAVGRQFWRGHPAADNHDLVTVVGVVGDTKQYGLDAATRTEVYYSYLQSTAEQPQFALRTAVPPLQLSADARRIVRDADATLPVTALQTMEQVVDNSVANPRTTLWLLAIFGGLALVLALIGIYGVVANHTQQRTQEIGIRMALGAAPGAIASMVLGESMRWVGMGALVGLGAGLAAGRLIAAQLYRGTGTDAGVLAAASAMVLLVGLAASLVPMARAARMAPLESLREL